MSKKPRKPGIALLAVADTYIDAMMWKDMLEQRSIPCMVRDGSATNAQLGGGFAGMGALPGAGQVEVYVPASALERSREILGVSLLPPARPTTSEAAAVSWVWLLWIIGPIVIAGIVAAVLL